MTADEPPDVTETDPPGRPDLADLLRQAEADHRRGDLDAAVAAYEDILRRDPDHFDALRLLSVACLQARQPARAEALARRALALRPDAAVGRLNLGNALADLGRWDEALAAFDQALARDPAFAPAQLRRGTALMALGRAAEALESFEAAAKLRPDSAQILNSRGNARLSLGRHREALADFDQALALSPDYATARYNRGVALMNLDDYAAALTAFDAALALAPDNVEALNNRSIALTELGRFEAALSTLDRALALRPDDPQLLSNRGHALERLGRTEEALALWERALAIDPEYANARWRRSLVRLARGQFESGWQDYERRWDVQTFVHGSAGQVTPEMRARLNPALTRADLAGRRVLAVGEQGVGDIIMFASMLPDLAADAAEVGVVCEPRLVRLLAHSFRMMRVLDLATAAADPPPVDRIVAMGSLGRLYRNRLQDFPGRPYLSAAPEAKARWAERLGPKSARLRVGLSWRGGIPRTGRSDRSLPLADLAPITALPGCEFVSLQYGETAEEIAAANAALPRPIRAFPKEEITDFDDIAALVQSLDVVVSVQTAVVHLSGAVGTPALVMLPQRPEWRYAALPVSMPWYGSVSLFRQDDRGDWDPVIARIAARLRRMAED